MRIASSRIQPINHHRVPLTGRDYLSNSFTNNGFTDPFEQRARRSCGRRVCLLHQHIKVSHNVAVSANNGAAKLKIGLEGQATEKRLQEFGRSLYFAQLFLAEWDLISTALHTTGAVVLLERVERGAYEPTGPTVDLAIRNPAYQGFGDGPPIAANLDRQAVNGMQARGHRHDGSSSWPTDGGRNTTSGECTLSSFCLHQLISSSHLSWSAVVEHPDFRNLSLASPSGGAVPQQVLPSRRTRHRRHQSRGQARAAVERDAEREMRSPLNVWLSIIFSSLKTRARIQRRVENPAIAPNRATDPRPSHLPVTRSPHRPFSLVVSRPQKVG